MSPADISVVRYVERLYEIRMRFAAIWRTELLVPSSVLVQLAAIVSRCFLICTKRVNNLNANLPRIIVLFEVSSERMYLDIRLKVG